MTADATRGALRHVLIAALVAGTIDIAYAIAWSVAHGGTVRGLLQAVASGWLGKAAFTGGAASAAVRIVRGGGAVTR